MVDDTRYKNRYKKLPNTTYRGSCYETPVFGIMSNQSSYVGPSAADQPLNYNKVRWYDLSTY